MRQNRLKWKSISKKVKQPEQQKETQKQNGMYHILHKFYVTLTYL